MAKNVWTPDYDDRKLIRYTTLKPWSLHGVYPVLVAVRAYGLLGRLPSRFWRVYVKM